MPKDILGDPELHFWLTRSVARVMGVNLSEAMASGHLSAQEYFALVTSCRGCAFVEACTCWLAEQATITPTAPPGCANAKVLERLARPQ